MRRLEEALSTPTATDVGIGKHMSHVTRSSDASSYDEVCINCGATDIAGGGWGSLAKPCPSVSVSPPDDQSGVKEADREAAASLAEWLSQVQSEWGNMVQWFTVTFPAETRKGIWDNHPWIEAFACHRQQSVAAALSARPEEPAKGEAGKIDDIRRSIIRQLGDDPCADRIILQPTDWDIVLAALTNAATPADQGDTAKRCYTVEGDQEHREKTLATWVRRAMRFIDLCDADAAGYDDLHSDAEWLTLEGYLLFGADAAFDRWCLADLEHRTLTAFLDRAADPARTAEGEMLRAALVQWQDWYRRATADDDCEYLNGDGWADASEINAYARAALTSKES